MIGTDLFRWAGCEPELDEIIGLMVQIREMGVFNSVYHTPYSESVSQHMEFLAHEML